MGRKSRGRGIRGWDSRVERHGIARMRLVETQRVVVCAPFSFSFFFFVFFFLLFSFFPLFFFLSSSLFPSPPLPPSPPSYPSSHRLEPISPRCSGAPSGSSLPVRKLLVLPSGPFLPSPPRFRFPPLRHAFGPFRLWIFRPLPPSLLPLLNNCPPRGKDETRLLPGPSSTTGGIERCISTMYPSSLPSSTKKALDRALRNTFSFVSLDQWLGKRIAIPILLRSINLIVKRL